MSDLESTELDNAESASIPEEVSSEIDSIDPGIDLLEKLPYIIHNEDKAMGGYMVIEKSNGVVRFITYAEHEAAISN